MSRLVVGKSQVIVENRSGEKQLKTLGYLHVEYDKDGWADSSKYLPIDCDLVYLRNDDGSTKQGWRSTNVWDGMKVKDGEDFKYWKRRHEET